MAATIQLRRGLQANVSGASLSTGEIIFTTDTGLVYVYDGSNKKLIGRVDQDTFANRPSFGVSGRLFYATDTGDTYLDTGSAWVAVGVNDLASMTGDLDDIADGTNYQRVAATEVDANGQVTQVRATSGAADVTGDTIKTHLDSTSNPHTVTASQVGIDDLDDISDGSSYQRVAATEVDANGQVTQVRATSGAANVTGDSIKNHIDSTSNPHSTSIANIGSGTVAQLNAALSDATVGAGLNDAGSGTSDLWSANKISSEIQSNINGHAWKAPCRAATTAEITLSNPGTDTFDTITLSNGERLLVKDQTTNDEENGIYIFNGSGSALTRATDNDTTTEMNGATVRVLEGSAHGDMAFTQTEDDPTIDTDTIAWIQTSGAGEIVAGTGLSKSTDTLNVGDAGKGVQVNADDLEIDANEIAGTGLEQGASSHLLRLATQGNGIAGGNGSTLSVDSDTETGGNVQGVNVTANGVGVDISAIAGTGIEADGSANLRLAAQGNGIAGGAGSTLSVDAYNGITVDANGVSVDADSETGGNIQPANVTANGVGVDISAIAGTGVEADGSANLRLAAQGNGIAGGAGSTLSVDADSETGGNIQAVNVTANGVGVDINAVAGTGIEADGAANLRLAAQGNGIAGGAGSTLSVASDTATGATVAAVSVTANGVGVAIDNSSIVHDNGGPDVLSVGVVDGGTF